jgi:hypothetical protein
MVWMNLEQWNDAPMLSQLVRIQEVMLHFLDEENLLKNRM